MFKYGNLLVPATIIGTGPWPHQRVLANLHDGLFEPSNYQLRFTELLVAATRARGAEITNRTGISVKGVTIDPPNGTVCLDLIKCNYFDGLADEALRYTGVIGPLGDAAREVVVRSRINGEAPLPRVLGLATAVVTSDGWTFLVHRTKRHAVATGAPHSSIVGGIRFPRDTPHDGVTTSIPMTSIVKQADEELNLQLNLSEEGGDHLYVWAVGIDHERLDQVILPSVCFTKLTLRQIMDTMGGAADSWEVGKFEPVLFNPSSLGSRLLYYGAGSKNPMPASGICSLLGALLMRFPQAEVEAALTP